MPQIKGNVERISSKVKETPYGERFAIGIVIEGEWYNFLSKKTPEELGMEEGSLVAFRYSDNSYGHQLEPKSLKVAKGKGTAKGKSSGRAASSSTAGIACGHAITNAVQLCVAEGDTSNKAIYAKAVDILSIAVHLQSRYEKIVESAKEGRADEMKPSQEPRKAEKPEPEPEEEPEGGEEEEVEFDDDLPF